MKKVKAFISSLLMIAATLSVTACGSSGDSSKSDSDLAGTTLNTEDQTLAAEDKDALDNLLGQSTSEAASGSTDASAPSESDADDENEVINSSAQADELLTGELENKTIKWLSDWDINPGATGKKTPADLYIFQQRYGGEVEYHQCPFAQLYDKLSESISGGEGLDFFYAGNMDAIPKGAIRNMFASADDYIDFESPLWEDVADLNDQLMWNGHHYTCVIQPTADNCAVLYNRKTIQEAGLDDPAVLFENGEWTWDTFQDMLEKFVDPANNKYGIDGWWFEFGLMNTIGVPPVGIEDGQLVSNIDSPEMERVQNWMYDLYQTNCIAIGVGDYGWTDHPEYIGEGKLLFYPVGLWKIYSEPEQWRATFGDDLFFVPMPKDPNADEYYIPVGVEAYSFINGGQNPEGVAAYLNCKRFTLVNEQARAVADAVFEKDYGWTPEMVEMKQKMQELADANAALDVSKGVSKDCSELLDNSLRNTARGIPWNETYDSIHDTVDNYLEEINESAG